MVPAFVGGFPGGIELAVIFVILALLSAVVVVLLVGGQRVLGGRGGEPRGSNLEARVAELEDEVAALRRELREHRNDH